MTADTTQAGDNSSDERRRSLGMALWVVATLLSVGSAWCLWKIYGRQLMAAPGELLLTMTRPEAVELPYPVEDLGPQWGLLILGELTTKYGRMVVLLAGWWCGAVLLMGLIATRLRVTGLSLLGRVLFSIAGLAVYGSGVFLLQAGLRAAVIYDLLAGVGSIDPFDAAQQLPLHLGTRACFLLLVASLALAAVAGLGFGRGSKSKGRGEGYLPFRPRVVGFRLTTVLAFAAMAVLLGYALKTWSGPIPQLLAHRAGDLEEAEIVADLNGILNGLRLSGIAMQLGGLLWVVSAWVAPGMAGRAKSR